LARAWGLLSVLICTGMLLNKNSFIGMMQHLQTDSISILIAGVIALSIGVAQVVGFNSWTADYRGLVTLFGWVSLLKGIAIIFVPGYLERFAQVFTKEAWYITSLAIFFIMGVYLCYAGFAKRGATEGSPVRHP
jgi:ABC-type arginine/histidine transport system permease subunit